MPGYTYKGTDRAPECFRHFKFNANSALTETVFRQLSLEGGQWLLKKGCLTLISEIGLSSWTTNEETQEAMEGIAETHKGQDFVLGGTVRAISDDSGRMKLRFGAKLDTEPTNQLSMSDFSSLSSKMVRYRRIQVYTVIPNGLTVAGRTTTRIGNMIENRVSIKSGGEHAVRLQGELHERLGNRK